MPPNMTPDELEKWKNRQIAALIRYGQNPIDAANQVERALAKMPPGADPNTYVPRDVPNEDLSGKAVLDDMRAAWYQRAEPRDARLLDARSVE